MRNLKYILTSPLWIPLAILFLILWAKLGREYIIQRDG